MLKKLLLMILSIFIIGLILLLLLFFYFNHFKYNRHLIFHQAAAEDSPAPSAILKPKPVVRILVLDGGGVHGLSELYTLEELEKISGQPINKLFDVVVGASTGSIIAVSLTEADEHGGRKFAPNQLINVYNGNVQKILTASKTRTFFTLGGLLNGVYSIRHMHHTLNYYLGDQRLNQAVMPVIVPTYCVGHSHLMFFESWYKDGNGSKNSLSGNFSVTDVATTSSAIPLLFNPAYIAGNKQCQGAIDSAAFVSDPSLYALSIIDHIVKAKKYIIVDLGVETKMPSDNKRLNGIYWLKNFVTHSTSLNAQLTKDFLTSRFVKDDEVTFWSFFPTLNHCVNPLDTRQYCIDYITTTSKSYLKQQAPRLERLAQQLETANTGHDSLYLPKRGQR